MKFSIAVVLSFQLFLPTLATAEEKGDGCVGTLEIERLVSEALPEGHLVAGGGLVNNSRHLAMNLPPGISPPLADPKYPVHSVIQFRFEPELDDPDQYRYRLCDVVEVALTKSCDSVDRSNLVRTCSFRTQSSSRNGTLDILPEDEEASAFFVIVVASEW